MPFLLSWLGTSLVFPVVLYLAIGRLPLVVICLLNIVLGLVIFRYVRNARALRAAELKNLADALWGLWSFVSIVLLFGSLDVLEGLDLRAIVAALRRWPLLYGLLANGLLVTATIRTAGALTVVFPQRLHSAAAVSPLLPSNTPARGHGSIRCSS